MIFIFSAPSGAGKDTVIEEVLRREPRRLRFSKSWTTRQPRNGDRGKYHYTTCGEFKQLEKSGFFVESEEVHGNLYGTPAKELVDDGSRSVVVEVNYRGAKKIRALCPEARTIFILPPSYAELEKRLRNRGSEEGEEEVRRRLVEATEEISHAPASDFWIENDKLNLAVEQVIKLMIICTSRVRFIPSCFRDHEILKRVQNTFSVNV